MWQPVLKWLIKYVWPEVQRHLAKLLVDLAEWSFDRIKEFYREFNQRREREAQDKAQDASRKAKEAQAKATEAEQKAAEAERQAAEAEQRFNEARADADTHAAEIARYKAEIEQYKAELEKLKLTAEVEKQQAIAAMWRKVADMLGKDQEAQEQGLETLRNEAVSRAEKTVATLEPADVFPKELSTPALPPPDNTS